MTTNNFTANAKDLKRALAHAMQAVERRNIIPVLSMVRITTINDEVQVRGTDLNVECIATAQAISITGKIDTTLNPNILHSLLRWAEGDVTISREKDLITIQVDNVVATLRELCPAKDYPVILAPSGDAIMISQTQLHKALAATIACISTEETRHYLGGVFLHNKGKGLIATATDGHRMAIYNLSEPWPFEDQIIPKKTITLLHRTLKTRSNGTITVRSIRNPKSTDAVLPSKNQENQVEFKGDDWTIVSKTIDGTFPDYTRVTPKPSQNITAVITAAALRRFPLTNKKSRTLKIDPMKGQMIHTNPNGIEVSMPVQATGQQSVKFNMNYLIDFANRAKTIRLEMASQNEPARVLTDDPALLQVLMPMRI